MKVYQVFEEKNHEGRYFKEWELPVGFPIPHDFILIPPTEGLKNPKFDLSKQVWIESEEDLISELIEENQVLRERIIGLANENIEIQVALAEIYEMMMEGSL